MDNSATGNGGSAKRKAQCAARKRAAKTARLLAQYSFMYCFVLVITGSVLLYCMYGGGNGVAVKESHFGAAPLVTDRLYLEPWTTPLTDTVAPQWEYRSVATTSSLFQWLRLVHRHFTRLLTRLELGLCSLSMGAGMYWMKSYLKSSATPLSVATTDGVTAKDDGFLFQRYD
jgi:hypothetical protein